MVLAVTQQLAGLAIIFTYSTCMIPCRVDSSANLGLRLLFSRWLEGPLPRLCHSLVSYAPVLVACVVKLSLTYRCCNLLAVLLWSLTADKLGRRTIINTCQTLVVAILFIVGGLHWSGATGSNAAAGTALVCPTFLILCQVCFADILCSWSSVASGPSHSKSSPCPTLFSLLSCPLLSSEVSQQYTR